MHSKLSLTSVLLAGLLSLMPTAGPAADIDITTFATKATLEDAIGVALAGSGITIESVTYTGLLEASGLFSTKSSTGIGVDLGLVLTSGLAKNITNRNTQPGITGDNQLPGHPTLTALIPGDVTFDATMVDITFTTNGGDLFFNYVFASDEYNEWVNSPFNDVFGFFIDGVNIALVPGTLSTPVSINNVNAGPAGDGVGATNPGYYRNNETGAFDFEYDGMTKVLTAYALGLGSGRHTISLGIADAGDYVLDSGVFIQAGTFSDREMEDDDGNDPDDGGHDFSNHGVPDGGATAFLLALALAGLGCVTRGLSSRR